LEVQDDLYISRIQFFAKLISALFVRPLLGKSGSRYLPDLEGLRACLHGENENVAQVEAGHLLVSRKDPLYFIILYYHEFKLLLMDLECPSDMAPQGLDLL
jgi:hypothetical protein